MDPEVSVETFHGQASKLDNNLGSAGDAVKQSPHFTSTPRLSTMKLFHQQPQGFFKGLAKGITRLKPGQASKPDKRLPWPTGEALKQSPWLTLPPETSSMKLIGQQPLGFVKGMAKRIAGLKPSKSGLLDNPKADLIKSKRDLSGEGRKPNLTKLQQEWEFDIEYSESWCGIRLTLTSDIDEVTCILYGTSPIWSLSCIKSMPSFIFDVEECTIEATRVATDKYATNYLSDASVEYEFCVVLDAIGTCQILNNLRISGELNFEELQQLCECLLTNQVETLELSFPKLGDKGARTLCKMMARNLCIKHLTFHDICLTAYTGAAFGFMLAENPTLEVLYLGRDCEMGPNGTESLLWPLSGTEGQPPLNTSLKHLTILGYGQNAAKAIGDMLATNSTLTQLCLLAPPKPSGMGPSDVCMILQSLKSNKTLQVLEIDSVDDYMTAKNTGFHVRKDVHSWDDQGREEVFVAMMKLLQENPSLKNVHLSVLHNVHRVAMRAQLDANAAKRSRRNVANAVKEFALDLRTSELYVGEGEVSQKMLEIQTFDDLEISVPNLKDCTTSSIGHSSIGSHEQDHEIMPHIIDNQNNAATTIGVSTNNYPIVTFFLQILGLITKYLRITYLDKVYQQVNGGVHEEANARQLLENFGQQHLGGIIVTSRIQVHEQRAQFLFGSTHAMTSVVGVGLDYAQVYWTQDNEILVEALDKSEWGQLWQEAFTQGSSFHEPIVMYMPNDVNDIITNESINGQMLEGICLGDMLGTTTCKEVFLLKLIATFFMTMKVMDMVTTNHDEISLRPKDLNVCNNIQNEGFHWSYIENFTIGETQQPNHLMGVLWHFLSRSGETRLEGVGDLVENHHDEYQGALSQNDKGANVGGDNNAQGSGDSCGGVGGGSNGDDNNAKDSEGSGGDNNAHGNDNSGDGVGGHNGNDGNERGDDDGGDNNEHSGGDGDKDSHPTKEVQNAIVKVQPGSRGYWYNREKQIRIDDPKDLKDVCITPDLSFEFLIDAHGLKTMKTTMSVLFDMKGAMPNENETKRFGWFQRQLEVSLECSEDGGAKLHGDGVLEQEDESQKRIWMENMQSNSGHIQYGMNGSVRGGLPMIQGELGGLFSRSMGTSSSTRQHTIEIPNKQISGGFVPIRMTSGGSKPCLSYKFNYMKYPKDINEVDNEAKRELYITTGLCSSLSPKVVGTWDELEDDKLSYLYTFEAQRIVCELKKTNTMFGILKSKSIRREVEQKYKVEIHVNHKMTHICKFKPRKAFKEGERDTLGELLEVGRVQSPPRQPPLTPFPRSSVSHHSSS